MHGGPARAQSGKSEMPNYKMRPLLNLSGDMKHAFACKGRSGGIELGSTAASHEKSHLLSFCAGIGV